MQGAEHPDGVLGQQQHNQTIMITSSQPQAQQPPQTPPIQQVSCFEWFFKREGHNLRLHLFMYFKAQGMMQGQMQKMHVQNQQIVLTPSQSPQHNNMQMQTLSPQQQKPQSPQVNAVPGQFIRATRFVSGFSFQGEKISHRFLMFLRFL